MNTDRNKQHLNNFEIQNDMIDTNEQREKQTNFMEAAKATIWKQNETIVNRKNVSHRQYFSWGILRMSSFQPQPSLKDFGAPAIVAILR